MLSHCESFDIFKNEALCIKLVNKPHKITNELITRIIESSVAHQGKALARRATEDATDRPAFQARPPPDLVAGKLLYRCRDHGGLRKVEPMHGAMHGVDLDGSLHVEA